MSFANDYAARRAEADLLIEQLTERLGEIPEPLFSAMKYSLSAGGKRLRPVLFLESCRIFGAARTPAIEKIACAIECMHTYSLIHDDLPCMDDDDFRRGKPTNHKVYGEATAVLAGDALLNLCYELLFEAAKESGDLAAFVKAGDLIARRCGGRGLIAGQILDIGLRSDSSGLSGKLNYIYQHKTGDLITASLLAGAAIGHASDEEVMNLREYGDNFGFSFQIRDDIDDLEEKGGAGDNTFVHIYGEKNARITLADSIDKAVAHLNFIHRDIDFLKKLALKSLGVKR